MEVLPYQIPPFKTVAWVSDEAKELWAPRFQKINEAVLHTALKSITNEECTKQHLIVEGVMYFKLLQLASLMEIEVNATFLGDENIKGPVFYEVLLTRKGTSIKNSGSNLDIVKEKKRKETVWEAASEGDNFQKEATETTIRLSSEADTSVFWQKLIATFGTRHRCSLSCKQFLKEQTANIKRMYHYGYQDEANWLHDIYSWPVEWCANHGICELRTPVVKVAYDTDATAKPYVVQIEGNTYPKEGAPGKRFPYQKRSFLRITDSKSFKAGLHHGS